MPRILPKIEGLAYGADYNPEQWPEEVWAKDMALMKEAGVNLVSVAIFAWANLNPEPGRFTFGWLDRLMDGLAENGIFADLATATASPPAWLAREFPDSVAVDRDGTRFHHGSRQNYSPCSRAFREHASALVRAMAGRYRDHPALACWHLSNEFTCHTWQSYGPEDLRAFRQWLQAKYGDLDRLNKAWNTAFWSQTYHRWEEVGLPMKAPYHNNPTQELDYRRFMSDAFVGLIEMEAGILRELSPGVPVTHNFMRLHAHLDQYKASAALDFASIDLYPDPDREPMGCPDAMDAVRGVKPGRPWLLLEQVTSQVNWRPRCNRLKPPGQQRVQSLQAVARGSEGALFFQWRQSRAGSEMYHGALVQHAHPRPNRIWREVCETGALLQKLAPVAGSLVESEVAVLFDWESSWALRQPGKPSAFQYNFTFNRWSQAVGRTGYCATGASPREADLSRYRVVFAHAQHVLDQATADHLRTYVEAGGHLVFGFFSGVCNEDYHAYTGGFPGLLQDVFGLWVEEWQPLDPQVGEPVEVVFADGTRAPADTFSEVVHAEGAEVLATFAGDIVDGSPAFLKHAFGKGCAWYLATMPDEATLQEIAARIAREAGARPVLPETPPFVEATVRGHPETGERFLFVLNHAAKEQSVGLGEHAGRSLFSGEEVTGRMKLAARMGDVLRLHA